MTPPIIRTASEMYVYEKHIMEEKHVPALLLMEGAAQAIYRQMVKTIAPTSHILAVAGSGNNGADAIAVARLFVIHGGSATVLLMGDPLHASVENQQQQAMFESYGGSVTTQLADVHFNDYDAVIDGLFGIGLNRPVIGTAADVIDAVNLTTKPRIYAVDVPSGLSVETGVAFSPCVKADETITFGCYKHGMELTALAPYFGNITVDDIGFFIE
ncbi:MAG: NAD(P)H-hydrate epimerase [Aerococcus sp.]|nr:NAD(P)H-hydrate epimerase [Aerococcus sp.]